jgi:Arc/MetJ-type ribon-helix-helix transcriptional regulator
MRMGRRANGKNGRRVSVELDEGLDHRLRTAVESSGRDAAAVIRAALDAYLKLPPTRESCLAVARRHRLIGVVRGLPADLSTNPDHFNRFGR